MKEKHSDFPKLKFYIPEETYKQMKDDAKLFEIFKSDRATPNMNRFITLLILGFYETYLDEYLNIQSEIKKLAAGYLDEENALSLADSILQKVFLPEIRKKRGTKSAALSYKVTSETSGICSSVSNAVNKEESVSSFFAKMFISYCSRPLSERERIIFCSNFLNLKKYCSNRTVVSFEHSLSGKTFTVIPYEMVTGKEEIFNYLLAQIKDEKTGDSMAISFRLNRIKNLRRSRESGLLTDNVKSRLDRMKTHSPQYAINSDDIISVRLSTEGLRLYNVIYYARPQFIKSEPADDGVILYFDCSENQLLQYFGRFETGAEILSPQSVRQKLIEFHEGALESYLVSPSSVINRSIKDYMT